jgi:hypothetical protein
LLLHLAAAKQFIQKADRFTPFFSPKTANRFAVILYSNVYYYNYKNYRYNYNNNIKIVEPPRRGSWEN